MKFCDFVCPSITLPKLKLVGETLRPAVAPVPDKLTVSGDPGASLDTFTVPIALPIAVGANCTFNVAVCDAFNVAGVVTPETLNPVPAATTLEMCTAVLPLLVRITLCVAVPPVATLPKLKLVVFAVNCPAPAGVPVPLSGTSTVGVVGSLLVRVMLPLAAPVAAGE